MQHIVFSYDFSSHKPHIMQNIELLFFLSCFQEYLFRSPFGFLASDVKAVQHSLQQTHQLLYYIHVSKILIISISLWRDGQYYFIFFFFSPFYRQQISLPESFLSKSGHALISPGHILQLPYLHLLILSTTVRV